MRVVYFAVLAVAAHAADSCAIVNDTILGSFDVTFQNAPTPTVEKCCDLCSTTPKCVIFTFETQAKQCFLKSAEDSSRASLGDFLDMNSRYVFSFMSHD